MLQKANPHQGRCDPYVKGPRTKEGRRQPVAAGQISHAKKFHTDFPGEFELLQGVEVCEMDM